MSSRTFAVVSVFFALIFACTVSAQTFRGSIQGTITDSTGAALPGASVKVFSPGTGLSRVVPTNDLGGYVASELPLGTYSITVSKAGFRTTELTNIPVGVGSPTRADAKLATGAVEEVVEVTADIPLVETTSNTTGGTIESVRSRRVAGQRARLYQAPGTCSRRNAAIPSDPRNRPAPTDCSA